jgi:hypothetical protein
MHALSRHADCVYSVEDLMETNPKPKIVSTTGNAIKEEALRKFETSLLGEVIHPREERYERSGLLWNGMTDPRHPGMIVRCATTVDVIRSVEFARTNELALAVRAGVTVRLETHSATAAW